MVREIIQFPNPILTTPAQRLDTANLPIREMRKIAVDLRDTMTAGGYYEVHAKQLGIDVDAFGRIVWEFGEPTQDIQVVFNPRVFPKPGSATLLRDDACLSVRGGKVFKLNRFDEEVKLVGVDENTQDVREDLYAHPAVIVQHARRHGLGELVVGSVEEIDTLMPESQREEEWDRRREAAAAEGYPNWYNFPPYRIQT